MRGRGCYAIYPLSQCLSASFPASWPTLHLIHISYAYLTEQGINATLCNIDDVFPTPLTRCPTVTLCQTPLSVCMYVCVCGACAVWQTSVSLTAQAVTGRCPSCVTHRIELEVRIFIIFQLYCLPRRRYPLPPLTLRHITSLLSCGCPLRHTTGHSTGASVGTWHAAIRGDFL